MSRPYGKRPKKEAPSKKPPNSESSAFKIKLRGRDNAPLTMTEIRQGLYDIARALAPHEGCRAKWVTLYLTMVDEDGREVCLDPKGEWTLYPYKSAAEEKGL
jgi:hypothetical protein